jgi:DNA-binding GntR family transcriptional regulator
LTGKERIIPIALNEEVAKFFEVEVGDPAIILIKTMKNYNQPVEYTKGIFKNGKYELSASIVKINI